jgi:adenine-specific DNA-methyltransferase
MPILDWLNKTHAVKAAQAVPYRLPEAESVHGDAAADNWLIQGDNLEHSQWLSMIYPRLELLRELLAEDGSLWVSIDDNEAHYLKVVLDGVFGRGYFITTVIWRKNYAPKSSARHFSDDHDYIVVYAKNAERWVPIRTVWEIVPDQADYCPSEEMKPPCILSFPTTT